MKFELATVLYAICVMSCTHCFHIETNKEEGTYPEPLKKQLYVDVEWPYESPVTVAGKLLPLPIGAQPTPEADRKKPVGILVEEHQKTPEKPHHPYQQIVTPPPQQKPQPLPQRPPAQTYPLEVGQKPQPNEQKPQLGPQSPTHHPFQSQVKPKPQQKPVNQPQRPPLYPYEQQPQPAPQPQHPPQISGIPEPAPQHPNQEKPQRPPQNQPQHPVNPEHNVVVGGNSLDIVDGVVVPTPKYPPNRHQRV